MKIPEQKMDYYKEPQRAVDVDAGFFEQSVQIIMITTLLHLKKIIST